MIYGWLVDIIGYGTSMQQNSTIVQLSGFLVIMIFVLCIDMLINGIFRLFRRNR